MNENHKYIWYALLQINVDEAELDPAPPAHMHGPEALGHVMVALEIFNLDH